ncbi:facilitated trehalose transporter Tret1-like isoform X2 [Cimex lectularius]|nr:facilitated trehalose transporter Tret1-like isoform X2 [Cimex lectularius]
MSQGASTANLVEGGTKYPQFLATFIATIGGFSMGTMLAWSSPVQECIESGKYGFPTSVLEFSLIGAFLSIGAMVGALGCSSVCNYIGRKKTMISLVCPAVVGSGLILWAQNPPMMMAGRVIVGIPVGAYSMVCPLYTNEISQISIRGILGIFFQLQVTIGILFVYILGLIKNPFLLTLIISAFPILLAVLMCFMPETPYYLLMTGRENAARNSLQWLRGADYNINSELTMMKENIDKAKQERSSFRKAFMTRAAKRGLIIGIGVMFLQQFSGINAVIFYTNSIFKSAGSTLDDSISSIIVGFMSVVATAIATLFIERLGRKPLMFISCLVMALSSAVLGIYFYIQTVNHELAEKISFIPLIIVCVFIIVFSLGLGPIPWVILAEIFPSNIKGIASSISCLTNWMFAFIVILSFQSVKVAIGEDWTFWIFSSIMILGCIFVIFVIPETKGKSIDVVQKELGGADISTNHSQNNRTDSGRRKF